MVCSDSCHRLSPFSGRAHCSVCHNTFTGISTFDQHRVRGACVLAAPLAQKDGIWGNWGSSTSRWWDK